MIIPSVGTVPVGRRVGSALRAVVCSGIVVIAGTIVVGSWAAVLAVIAVCLAISDVAAAT